MTQLVLCLCSIIMVFFTDGYTFTGDCGCLPYHVTGEADHISMSATEALDLVKEKYADNFEKVYYELTEETEGVTDTADYYYKLPFEEYYLVYEGRGETEKDYLFHLYEFVLDEPDTGIGHTVTYGWYTVDSETGLIR